MITITDVNSIIQELSQTRPIFHSEADFQHALAWLIHEKYPEVRVRLEVNPYKDGQRDYIDILLNQNGVPIPIELKYKTKSFDYSTEDEDFHLLNQAANPLGRYDFIKDIVRLERFTQTHSNTVGFAIFLSNDSSYWKASKHENSIDSQFKIHENITLKGSLQWGELTSDGTRGKRKNELLLNGEYPLIWQNYSNVDGSSGSFKYLLLEIRNHD